MPDPTNNDATNPTHYRRLDPEPIVVIERWGLDFCLGNAVKYLARAGHKPGADRGEDLAKARWYLERAISGGPAQLQLVTSDVTEANLRLAQQTVRDAQIELAELRAERDLWQTCAKAVAARLRERDAAIAELRSSSSEVSRG